MMMSMAWTMMPITRREPQNSFKKFRNGLHIDTTTLMAKVGTTQMRILGVKLAMSSMLDTIIMDDEDKEQMMGGREFFCTYKPTIQSVLALVLADAGVWSKKWKKTELKTGPLCGGYGGRMLQLTFSNTLDEYSVVFALALA